MRIGLHQARENNIPWDVDAWVSSEYGITLQALFINIIDNALEEYVQFMDMD